MAGQNQRGKSIRRQAMGEAGTKAQKEELCSQGALGDETDPGDRIILEWRNLKQNSPHELVMIVVGPIHHLRRVNQ